jgi:nicotinamidase-related amidase
MISSEHALVIIDMQEGLFRGPASPHSADAVLTNILLLIAKARQSQVPIFFIRHVGPDGSPLCEQPVNQADSRAGCGR